MIQYIQKKNYFKLLFFFTLNFKIFMISFILIIILVLTLLKKNYVNVYCLTAFNIIFILLFLTLLFQKFLINKSFYVGSFFVFPGTNPALYTFDIVLNFTNFLYLIRYNFFLILILI